MRIPRSLATIAAAGAFTLAAPAGFAQADTVRPQATGAFNYQDNAGDSHTIANPQNDTCIEASGGAGMTQNQTDSDAFVFRLPNCDVPGAISKIPAGGSSTVPFASVIFATPES